MSSITLSLGKRAKRAPRRRLPFLRKAIVPIVVVVLWEVAARAGMLDVRFIPAPSRVLMAWYQWVFGTEKTLGDPYVGTWTLHALQSGYRVLLGFVCASIVGILLGVLIGYFRLFGE